MKLTFAGSGDAFGSGGRFNTCFHIEANTQDFLIDCGASSMIALNTCGVCVSDIRTIFLSHLHGDHFGGLPFLLLAGQFVQRRKMPLTIAGPPGTAERLQQAQEVLFPGSSKIEWRFDLDIVELETGSLQNVNGISVTPYEVDHYSGAPAYALRIGCEGKIICYSGDTEWVDNLVAAADNADLFICECYGYGGRAPFHIDHDTLMSKRQLLNARRIIITHMGPSMLDRVSETEFEAAYDGLVVNV